VKNLSLITDSRDSSVPQYIGVPHNDILSRLILTGIDTVLPENEDGNSWYSPANIKSPERIHRHILLFFDERCQSQPIKPNMLKQ